MSYIMPAHSKNAGLMEYGAKRSATPLYLREEVTRGGKAPSPMRYASAVQKMGNDPLKNTPKRDPNHAGNSAP